MSYIIKYTIGELAPYNELTFKYFHDVLENNIEYPYEHNIPIVWTDEFIDWEIQDKEKEKRQNGWLNIKNGKVTGRLIIGNLDTLTGI